MTKIWSYIRVSTPKQDPERQRRNIKEAYPEAIIVQETYTGTKMDRPQWTKLLNCIRPNDSIVFDSVSRMSRNAAEGFAIYEELFNKGINLVFLKEPHINTSTYRKALNDGIPMTGTNVDVILEGVNRYLMLLAQEQIRLAFEQSEKEVLDLRQRTVEGIETARLAGKQIGGIKGRSLTTQKSIIAKEIIRRHSKDFGGTLKDDEVMTLTGVSHNSYYKYKKEVRQETEIIVYEP